MLAVDASDKILLGSSAGTSGAGLDIETNAGPITIGNFASAVTVSAPTTLGITGGATGSRPRHPCHSKASSTRPCTTSSRGMAPTGETALAPSSEAHWRLPHGFELGLGSSVLVWHSHWKKKGIDNHE